jgi:hypothetical protein
VGNEDGGQGPDALASRHADVSEWLSTSTCTTFPGRHLCRSARRSPHLPQHDVLRSFLSIVILTDALHGGDEFRDVDADDRTLTRFALDIKMKIGAVENPEALADVA